MSTAATAPPAPDRELTVDFGGPYDLARTLAPLQRGYADPSIRLDKRDSGGAGAWAAFRVTSATAGSPGAAPPDPGEDAATLRFDQIGEAEIRVRVWAGSDAAAEIAARRAPAFLGAEDDWAPFDALLESLGDPVSESLIRVRRRHPGVRLPATGQLFDQLVTASLEQKVTHQQARHGWRTLLRWHGERPPGPAPEWMRLPLTAAGLRRVPSWDWHKMWVQPPMAKTIMRLAERERSINRLGDRTGLDTSAVAALADQLQSISGIGQWTTAEALQRSHGSADLPAVGDYHLAHVVGEALTGRRTDDAGMLALLEPWSGHRQRAIRMIKLSGFRHQRYGPKLHPEDHRGR